MCLIIKLCNHQRPRRTKLLKPLYPTVNSLVRYSRTPLTRKLHLYSDATFFCVQVVTSVETGALGGRLGPAGQEVTKGQRWTSTLANRSNARHRYNIRAPPPPRCMYPKCGNLCGQKGQEAIRT